MESLPAWECGLKYFYFWIIWSTDSSLPAWECGLKLSEYIEGEFLGNVKHSGNLVYILKNSKAEDVTNLTLHIDAPHNENFENVGEEVKIDITLN